MQLASRWHGRTLSDMRIVMPRAVSLAGGDRDRSRFRQGLRERRTIWVLVALNLVAIAVILADVADVVPGGPAWLIVGLFALVESAALRLEIGGRPVVLVLRATPILAGLTYLEAPEVVAAHVVGATIALVVRNQVLLPGAVAGVAGKALGTVLGAIAFVTMLPSLGGTVAGWWVTACVVVVVANVTAQVVGVARWSPAERQVRRGTLAAVSAWGTLASVADASLALTVVIFLRTDISELWLLAAPGFVAAASYRAWMNQRKRHERVEFLYACTSLLAGPSSGVSMLDELLHMTRTTLGSHQAEVLLDGWGGRLLRASVGPGPANERLGIAAADPLRQRRAAIPAGARSGLVRWGRPVPGADVAAVGVMDAVVVGIEGRAGLSGTLTVAGRQDGKPFGPDDQRLLETLSLNLGAALGSSRMIEELGVSAVQVAGAASPVTTTGAEPAVFALGQPVWAETPEAVRARGARVQEVILELTAVRDPALVLRSVLIAIRDATGAEVAAIRLAGANGDVEDVVVACDGQSESLDELLADQARSRLAVPLAIGGGTATIHVLRPGSAPLTETDAAVIRLLVDRAEVDVHDAMAHERALAVVRDLDAANAALEAASRTRARFLADASHELRTPLHAILIAAQVLGDAAAAKRDPQRVRALPATIDRTGRHLLGLIDDLIDLARIDLSDMRLHVSTNDLASLLDDVRRQTEPLAEERGIRLVIADGVAIRVRADPLRLRQVILNLLVNAIKYTPRGGRVRLTVEERVGGLRISVRDTGAGIAPGDLERAFEPFERLGQHETPGAGLGLPLARRIVELHGGTLTATSTPGIGSVFTVRLPAACEHEDGTAVPAPIDSRIAI
jgi:signal transduction histidine kinase